MTADSVRLLPARERVRANRGPLVGQQAGGGIHDLVGNPNDITRAGRGPLPR